VTERIIFVGANGDIFPSDSCPSRSGTFEKIVDRRVSTRTAALIRSPRFVGGVGAVNFDMCVFTITAFAHVRQSPGV